MYYIGIDLGGTNIRAGVVDENGRIIYKESIPTNRGRSYTEIIKDMSTLVLKVIRTAGIALNDIKSIGIGSPGTPNSKEGILIYSNNLLFENVPMRTEMQKYIDLPVYLDNDANCAGLAESVCGAAKDVMDSVTITLGTGVGAGIVIGSKVFSGFNNAASELGHMVIISGGEQCTCGRKGCWETYASATALIRQTKKAAKDNPGSIINELVGNDLNKVDARTAFDAARKDDEIGKNVVRQYIYYIAEGLINIINAFEPEIIAIGGGVCNEGEFLLKPLREFINEGTYCKQVAQTQIKVAQMGNDAGIIGAAMLGR